MKTLTEEITQELLDAVDDQDELERVFRRHNRSKGPLYHALAQATALLKHRLATLSQQHRETGEEYQELQQQAKVAREEMTRLDQEQESKSRELLALDEKLNGKKSLLDQANELAGLGFGPDELSRLRELLAEVAASQGALPEEGVTQFFETVARYERIVSLDLEAKRAEAKAAQARAELERWEAEARSKESQSKARKETIDSVHRLLAQGVKEGDIPHWTHILAKAGVTPEGMAHALEHYASVEALVQDRKRKVKEMERQAATLEPKVKALTKEKDSLLAVIQAVREEALAEVRRAGEGMLATLKLLGTEIQDFGALKEQAVELRAQLVVARALRSEDLEAWRPVTPRGILMLLANVIVWAQDKGFNPQLTPPEYIKRTMLRNSYKWVTFTDLLSWAAGGPAMEECKALQPARVIGAR